MGWTVVSKHTDRKDIVSFLKEQFAGNHEVVDAAIRNNEAYLAVKNLTTNEVIGWVVLLSLKRNETGFKDISEDMGPMYFKCPKRIIKKLSPTQSPKAIAWRTACTKKTEGDVYQAAAEVIS
jgi:hypothetical protein